MEEVQFGRLSEGYTGILCTILQLFYKCKTISEEKGVLFFKTLLDLRFLIKKTSGLHLLFSKLYFGYEIMNHQSPR